MSLKCHKKESIKIVIRSLIEDTHWMNELSLKRKLVKIWELEQSVISLRYLVCSSWQPFVIKSQWLRIQTRLFCFDESRLLRLFQPGVEAEAPEGRPVSQGGQETSPHSLSQNRKAGLVRGSTLWPLYQRTLESRQAGWELRPRFRFLRAGCWAEQNNRYL